MVKKSDWIIGGSILFFILFLIGVFVLLMFVSPADDFLTSQDKVACVEIYGPIINAKNAVKQIKKYRKDKSVDAVVIRLETPGGSAAASYEIYEEIRKTGEAGKVVVASMGNIAASGGYYIACGAQKILANPGTMTGSIGVIMSFMNFMELADKLGLSAVTIKSGKFKDTGNPYRKANPQELKLLQEMTDDIHEQFIDIVHKSRKIDKKDLVNIADGRIFTGRQAKKLNLIDELGTYEDAISCAIKLAGISENAKIIRKKKKKLTIYNLLFDDLEETLLRLKYNMTVGYYIY